MSIIVDGYNYIGRSRELALSDPAAPDKLIYLLGQYGGKIHTSVTLVFDGNYFVAQANRKRQYGRVTVIYTSPIYTADDLIKKMIRTQKAKYRKTLLVVSSDADIVQYTQSHGASAIKSEEFEQKVQTALAAAPDIDRINIQLSAQEVQKWLKIFEAAPAKHDTSKRSVKPSLARAQKKPGTIPDPQNVKGKQGKHDTSGRASRKKLKRHPADRSSSGQIPEELDRINVHLSPEDVEEWLNIFGTDVDD
jgi:predicted RNA-binding protein with PIN domain